MFINDIKWKPMPSNNVYDGIKMAQKERVYWILIKVLIGLKSLYEILQ